MINYYAPNHSQWLSSLYGAAVYTNKQYDKSRKHGILLNGYLFFTT